MTPPVGYEQPAPVYYGRITGMAIAENGTITAGAAGGATIITTTTIDQLMRPSQPHLRHGRRTQTSHAFRYGNCGSDAQLPSMCAPENALATNCVESGSEPFTVPE